MAEEKKQINVTGEEVDDMTPDYLAAINELKQNSVDRSKYDALKAENKKLLDSIVNGQEVNLEAQGPTYRSVDEIREELFNHEHSNLDYIKLALELRSTLMAEGKPDPFIPVGKQISPTREDEEVAAKCAQVYQECVDYAEGDSEVFTNELMRRTRDVRIR